MAHLTDDDVPRREAKAALGIGRALFLQVGEEGVPVALEDDGAQLLAGDPVLLGALLGGNVGDERPELGMPGEDHVELARYLVVVRFVHGPEIAQALAILRTGRLA